MLKLKLLYTFNNFDNLTRLWIIYPIVHGCPTKLNCLPPFYCNSLFSFYWLKIWHRSELSQLDKMIIIIYATGSGLIRLQDINIELWDEIFEIRAEITVKLTALSVLKWNFKNCVTIKRNITARNLYDFLLNPVSTILIRPKKDKLSCHFWKWNLIFCSFYYKTCMLHQTHWL